MKRFLILFVVLGLTVGSLATAEAKKSRQRVERTVAGAYGPYPAPVTGCNSPLDSYACMSVQTKRGERFFTANVTDTHGQPVFVEVRAFSASSLRRHSFCGETEQPIPFAAGSHLEFDVAVGRDVRNLDCPTNRVKTIGTISVTLSNLP